MVNESRIDIYDYLYGLFYNVVSDNVYTMNEPQELTSSDVQDGFIVIYIGSIVDYSEFKDKTYAAARVFVRAFVPPISRGRLDYEMYKAFEDGINSVIKEESENPSSDVYFIQDDDVLSMDEAVENANNAYFVFTKSFLVMIDKPVE